MSNKRSEAMQIHEPSIDRRKKEHVSCVRRIVFHDKADDFVRVALAGDDQNLTACGRQPPDYFTPGIQYRFLGRWDEGKFGLQFKFDSVVIDTPLTFAGVVKYLTDVAPNVGTKTAEKLYRRYGSEAAQVLRESPGRVSEDGIMALAAAVEAAEELKKHASLERTRIELFGLFAGRGFYGRAIEQAIAKWGARAPQVIRRNPFAPMIIKPALAGAGFKRCDAMWIDLRRPAAALKRQMLAGWNAMRTNSEGHTWHPVETVGMEIRKAIDARLANPVKAMKLGKRSGWMRFRRDADGKLWVAESSKAINEQRIADSLHRLFAWTGDSLWPEDLPVSQVDGDGLPSEHQRENWLKATIRPVGILAGSPGTGKTHTLAFGLRSVIDAIGISNVHACAPTGKAAVRMTQSLQLRHINLRATTIHRTLGISKNGQGTGDWGFIHNRGNPLPVRVLIVDETSMVDADLMASLLDACADGTHVLFVGDPYQLPPVGHGFPLRDMIAAGVPCGELTQVRRNAGQIVHACLRIKNGESFDTCQAADLEAGRNLLMVETRSEEEAAAKLLGILANAKRFHPVWQTQVLVGINKKSMLSRVVLNDKLREVLNPDGYAIAGNPFRVGDKIICLKNSEFQVVEPVPAGDGSEDAADYEDVFRSEGDPESAYIANGEIGKVVAIAEGKTIARMGEDECLIRIPTGKQKRRGGGDAGEGEDDGDGNGADDSSESVKGRGCNFDLAYCITIHKSQGSESPCIIAMIDPRAGMIADRNLWYTAISRASKLCVLIGQRGVLDKQRAKVASIRRKTFLTQLIQDQSTPEKASDQCNT